MVLHSVPKLAPQSEPLLETWWAALLLSRELATVLATVLAEALATYCTADRTLNGMCYLQNTP